MSDLISRKKICDYIKGKINPYGKPFEGTAYELGLKIMRYINAMDSAYSVDKVIEELELHSFELGTDTLPVHYVRLNEAIEIVKQGSASDDACEWKAGKSNYEWQPNCEPNSTYNVFGVAWFKRCPYCGKKIKIVGD